VETVKPSDRPWRRDKPPNETWVEVRDGDTPIEAMAFFGRDGYLPHWRLRDESAFHPSRFTEWREIEIMNTNPKYVTLNGEVTDVYDLNRAIWYSAVCTYWTDDWCKLSATFGKIPCCPYCRSVGFQTTAKEWCGDVARFQAAGNPGYVNFIDQSRQQCKRPMGLMTWYKEWLQEHPNGRHTNPRSAGD
jgi:hypothetical protein